VKRSGWVVLGVVLVVLGVFGLLGFLSGLNQETSTTDFDGVDEVVFDISNSSITFSTTEGETEVRTTRTTGFVGGNVSVEVDNGTLRIEQSCPLFFGFGCKASFDVAVPAGTIISGATSNGAIGLDSTDGPVDVTTSNGAVNMSDVTSPLRVATSNGAIVGSNLGSETIEVRTSNGRIELDFAAVPELVRARTSNGAIEIVLPADTPPVALSTSTSNGSVDADIRTDPTANVIVDAETSNGDITVRYGD
jgi:DUF4097 and DUF4098 domain-containing protein YvlB